MAANSLEPRPLQQVRVLPCKNGNRPEQASPSEVTQDHHAFRTRLDQLIPKEYWAKAIFNQASPYPIVISQGHQRQLEDLHNALTLAIVDIVERWCTDGAARLPERMPLEAQEEELLRWMESQGPDLIRPFKECQGGWRPDMLLEFNTERNQWNVRENYRICEINARFYWNGSSSLTTGHKVLREMGVGRNGYVEATDPEKILNGLFGLVDPSRPLHLLKGNEIGYCIHTLVKYARDNLGIRARFITPTDLRLLKDAKAKGGNRLCCRVPHDVDQDNEPTVFEHEGELWEEIHQVSLELQQRELRALSPEMLQQLSLQCFNDLRTVFLVHDKRMLGIVLQEVPSLVARGILTPEQGDILRNGITETILPGSPELDDLMSRCRHNRQLKDEFILKAIRSGKGDGILFGTDLDQDTWTSKLDFLRNPSISSGETKYVVQRRIKQPLYDLVVDRVGKVRYPLVGTYHAVHGQLLGLGTWRFSAGNVTAVANGGAWCCSVLESGEKDVDAVEVEEHGPVSKRSKWVVPSIVSVCVAFLTSHLVRK